MKGMSEEERGEQREQFSLAQTSDIVVNSLNQGMGNSYSSLHTDFLEKVKPVKTKVLRKKKSKSEVTNLPITNIAMKEADITREINESKSSHNTNELMLSRSSIESNVFKETPRSSLTVTGTSLTSNRKAFSMINIHHKSPRTSLTPADAYYASSRRPRSSLNCGESRKLYSFHWRRRSTSTSSDLYPRWVRRKFR